MKNKGKLLALLVFLGIIAAFFVVPYMQDLVGEEILAELSKQGIEEDMLGTLIVVQAVIMYSLFALIGVFIYHKAGFRLPVFEKLLGSEEKAINWKSWLAWLAGGGLLIGIVLVAGDYIFLQLGSPLSLFESALPAWWKGLLGAYSAGVGEELTFRFFLMTLLTLLLTKVFKAKEAAAVWVSILAVALVFGALHLPATAALVELTPLVLVRALVLNGIGGIAFGWLYWEKGLESAMLAHFMTDIVVHGLLQLSV